MCNNDTLLNGQISGELQELHPCKKRHEGIQACRRIRNKDLILRLLKKTKQNGGAFTNILKYFSEAYVS